MRLNHVNALLSFLYFHWLFPLSARQTPSGNRSICKSTRERVDSKGLYGRWNLHLMGSCNDEMMKINYRKINPGLYKVNIASILV